MPAHLYSFIIFYFFVYFFLFLLSLSTPSRLVSIRLCPCMTVKKLSIQRKWKCHTAGDSTFGLSGFCYNLLWSHISYIEYYEFKKEKKNSLFCLYILVALLSKSRFVSVFEEKMTIIEISFLDELNQPVQPERQV